VFLVGIVGAVVGLKLVPHDAPAVETDSGAAHD
jgi:hypothetical protein